LLASFRRQFGLLGRAPSFRLLFLSTFASGLGTWLAVIALSVDVYARTHHSAKWVSALLIVDFLPAILIGLFLGPLVDRVSRKLLMAGADVVRLAVFCALPFADSPGAIVGLAAVAGVATGFFQPAVYAGLPNLVAEEDLAAANSLRRSTDYVTTILGTLAGGIVTSASGPHLAYWLNAASFLASALLLVRIPGRLLEPPPGPRRGHWRELAEGYRVVRSSRPLVLVLVAWTAASMSMGLINVSEIALAQDSFDAGRFGFGLLWSASGIGLAAGSFVAASWLERRGMRLVYAASIALLAIGTGGAAASPNVWVAVWCVLVGGLGNGAGVVYTGLLVQKGAPEEVRGRAFTLLMGSTYAVLGLGMIVGGPLTDALGARWTYALAATICGLAAVAAHVLARSLPRDTLQPAPFPKPA
jgi:MFS family permease